MNSEGRQALEEERATGVLRLDPPQGDRVFRFGFTTKPGGHGFGLQGAANDAQEMGGSLRADSAGPGEGATFTLELPVWVPALAAANGQPAVTP